MMKGRSTGIVEPLTPHFEIWVYDYPKLATEHKYDYGYPYFSGAPQTLVGHQFQREFGLLPHDSQILPLSLHHTQTLEQD